MLVLGNNPTLQAMATKDRKGATSPDDQVDLGDAWWDLGEKASGSVRQRIRQRADYWYEKALPGLTGLVKDMVKKRIQDATGLVNNTFDLFSRLDVKRDRVAGEWVQDRKTTAIRSSSRGLVVLMLPITVSGDYDLVVTFTRHVGRDDINVMLPVGSRQCMVLLSGSGGVASGLDVIDGQRGDKNTTTRRPGTLVNERRYTILTKVRLRDGLVTINVFLDNVPFLRWHGKDTSLDNCPEWKIPQPQHVGVGAKDADVTFHSAQLRMVSGRAMWDTN